MLLFNIKNLKNQDYNFYSHQIDRACASKPWIADCTLTTIDRRNAARIAADWDLERELNRQVKLEARSDRTAWLNDLVRAGDWESLKVLKRGFKPNQGRLVDSNGEFGARYQAAGTRHLVPGSSCQVPGAWYQVPSTWYLVPGTWYLEPGTRCLVPGTRHLVPCAWY